MRKACILGCGWLGKPVGIRLREEGFAVSGSTTSNGKLASIEAAGLVPFLIDLHSGNQPLDFFNTDVLLVAIPPKLRSKAPSEYLELIHRAARLCATRTGKVVFISSSSIYPDLNREVYEDDADMLSTFGKAENIFRDTFSGKTTIVRFAGLVGPDRHPGRFLSGKRVAGPQNPVNIIHLNDCVEVLMRVIADDRELTLNACADLHPSKKEFYTRACAMLGVMPPEFIDDNTAGWKVVDNTSLKRNLNFEFQFPDPMKMIF